jgi:hypothetical protein
VPPITQICTAYGNFNLTVSKSLKDDEVVFINDGKIIVMINLDYVGKYRRIVL